MSDNTIHALLPDQSGGLWVGTDGGLTRFKANGEWQTVFEEDIEFLLSDQNGGLWIKMHGNAIGHLKANGEIEYPIPNFGDFKCMLLEKNEKWIGTGDYTSISRGWGLINLKSDGSSQVFDKDNSGLPDNNVLSIVSDQSEGLWIGTYKGGLAHFKADGTWQVFNTDNSELPSNKVYCLLADQSGGLWVGTDMGLAHLKRDGKWENEVYSGPPDNRYLCLSSDQNGGLWIGTLWGLGHLKADGSWQVFYPKELGLPNNYVKDLLSDQNGGLWIKTHTGYLGHLKADGSWQTFDSDSFRDFFLDQHGGLWLGKSGFFYNLKVESDGSLQLSSSHETDIGSILLDKSGRLWLFKTGDNVSYLKSDGSWQIFDTEHSGLLDSRGNQLLLDESGGVWIFNTKVVHLKSDGSWQIFDTENPGLLGNYGNKVLLDESGGVWIFSTDKFVHLKSDGSRQVFDIENSGLPSDSFHSYPGPTMVSDQNEGLWIATKDGLAHLKSDGSWQVFNTTNSGLPCDSVWSLLSDQSGGLWIGTQLFGLAHLTFSSSQIQDEQYLKNGRAAIIIAGGGNTSDNALWDSTEKISNYAYKMLNKRGFLNTDIHYISPQPFADFNGDGFDDKIVDVPNPARQIQLSDIQAAFDWAKTKGTLNQPLYIFFTDHGGDSKLQLAKGVYIEASELKTMLDDYQQTTGNKVVFVIDACQSGTMVKALAGENRAIISSTGEGKAYFDIYEGKSFISYVTKGLDKGMNFNEAFYYASSEYKKALGKISQYESISAGSDTLNLTQEPQFDDTGDGLYNISVDGNWLKTVSVNGPWSNADVTLTVEAVTQSGVVSGLNPTPLKAKATLAAGVVRRVWAVIRPPQMDILVDNTGIPLVAFPKTELSVSKTEESVYEGSWNGFVYNGEYEITFYAQDNEGNIESSESIKLTVADDMACPEKGSLKVSTDKQPDTTGKITYKSGDKLKISVTENLAYGYDLYVALFMPDGNFTALKSPLTDANINYLQKENFNKLYWGDRWIETNRNINMGKSVDVVDLTLPQEKLVSGQYCVYAALIPEGQDLVAAANKGLIVLDGVCFEVVE